MERIIYSVLNGSIYGLLLFMVSSGLTLIFGMMGVLNFAHASFYMLGAYMAYTLQGVLGFWPAILVAPCIVALVGALVERVILRRIHAFGHAHELLVTFGLAVVIAELVKLFYGSLPVKYTVPAKLQFSLFSLAGMDYPFYRVFMGVVALIVFAALYLLLTRTRIGIVIRAAIYRPTTVEALGHNVPVVFMSVFGIGAFLAGLAGAIAGAFYTTNPNMALELGSIVFVVVVVGGLGSLGGAMLASILIGILNSLAVGVNASLADLLDYVALGSQARGIGGILTLKLSSIAATLPFFLMIVVLLVRPRGLMGEKE